MGGIDGFLTLQRSLFNRQFCYIIFSPYYIIMGWLQEVPEHAKMDELKCGFTFAIPYNKLFDYSSWNCKTYI